MSWTAVGGSHLYPQPISVGKDEAWMPLRVTIVNGRLLFSRVTLVHLSSF